MKPLKSPIFYAFLTRIDRPSAIITKRKGERGYFYLRPLPTTKSLVGLPFTKIDIWLVITLASIHLIQRLPKPIFFIIYMRKS